MLAIRRNFASRGLGRSPHRGRARRAGALRGALPILSLVLFHAPSPLSAQEAAAAAAPEIPTPASVIGWEPGADYRLADYGQILAYFRALDAASGRLRLTEIGTSAEGRPMVLALISSEENLEQLDRYRAIARRLALGLAGGEAEARLLAREGRAIVWIDGGLHATEVAGAQFPPELAYRLVAGETEEFRRIRREAIVLLMPVMNPDGLEKVVGWYRRNVGTPFETAPLPWLYQKYVGHDNNRDFFMILQPETRAITRQLWQEWFPQIVLNHHQTAPFPARIFIPPFADPVNPRIPPLVVTGINLIGTAIHQRFAEEGKPGAVSRISFTQWWNGGMRTAPYFHNQIGLLTEVALHEYATPREYPPDSLPRRFSNGLAADRPSTWYPDPWRGGWWRLRDAVEYMVTASLAVAEIAAERREDWLWNAYRMARDAIRRGEGEPPFGYVVDPAAQRDPGEAVELLEVLRRGGIRVERLRRPLRANGRTYAAGAFFLPAAQPYRPYLLDLMEPQEYPDRRLYPDGPPDPPYDLAGWTLPLQMGVRVDRLDEPVPVVADPVEGSRIRLGRGGLVGEGPRWLLSAAENASYRVVNRWLAEGGESARASRALTEFRARGRVWPPGTFVLEGDPDRLADLLREADVEAVSTGVAETPLVPVERPLIGLYRSWVANIDEGWTRWVFEQYGFAYATLTDRDVREGDLRRFDAIVIPDQDPRRILHGHPRNTMPADFVGGLGLEGALALRRFVERGGTLVALDDASDFVIDQFGLPIRNSVRGLDRRSFFIPGSLIRTVVDPEDPLGWGMDDEAAAFFVRSRAFEIARAGGTAADDAGGVAVPVRYAERDLLLSGWELGAERHLSGKAAVVRVPLGDGFVVLFGFRPQFRGQPRGTFKLLFNALYGAPSETSEAAATSPRPAARAETPR